VPLSRARDRIATLRQDYDAITLGILDEATARRLDAVFEKYAPHCREIELASWRMRGLGHRLKDNAYYLLNAQMPTTSEPSAFATCARIGLEHSTRALASVFKPMREIKR